MSKAFILLALMACPFSTFADGPYVDYSTFLQWLQRTPSGSSLEVCGLTTEAHRLWAQKQLRVPAATFMPGDYSGTGRMDFIVQLHERTSGRPCDLLLIVTHDKGSWQRLFVHELPSDKAHWTPRWFSDKRAIGIDLGEHRRRTGPAEMRWSEAASWSSPGFVVEDARIDTSIEWHEETHRYVLRSIESPEWWQIDQQ